LLARAGTQPPAPWHCGRRCGPLALSCRLQHACAKVGISNHRHRAKVPLHYSSSSIAPDFRCRT
jgi:hypothetical protein